jgi:hypothetical protein
MSCPPYANNSFALVRLVLVSVLTSKTSDFINTHGWQSGAQGTATPGNCLNGFDPLLPKPGNYLNIVKSITIQHIISTNRRLLR